MIKTEAIGDLIRTYSDSGYYIHGGLPEGDYTEAIDPVSTGRTYTETTTLIETVADDTATDAEKAQAYDILTGAAT